MIARRHLNVKNLARAPRMGHILGCVSVWPRYHEVYRGHTAREESPHSAGTQGGGGPGVLGLPPVPGPSPSARVAAPLSTFVVCRWARPPPLVLVLPVGVLLVPR